MFIFNIIHNDIKIGFPSLIIKNGDLFLPFQSQLQKYSLGVVYFLSFKIYKLIKVC